MDSKSDRDAASPGSPLTTDGLEAWLAIELIRCGSPDRWSVEITTASMKTISWPVRFKTPERALEVAREIVDQLDSDSIAFFSPTEGPRQ